MTIDDPRVGADASERRPRVVLGPDPLAGSLVLLPEGYADHFKEVADIILESATTRDYVDRMARHDPSFSREEYLDDHEDQDLDAPFELEDIPGYGDGDGPDARVTMVDALYASLVPAGDLYDVLGELVEVVEPFMSSPKAWIEPANVDAVRRQLEDAGIKVIGWDEL